jgi:hypothetical protein
VVERRAYRQMETLGAPYPRSMRTVGGGAANPAWTQIRAQVLGVAMADPASTEAAYGTALLARKGVGHDSGSRCFKFEQSLSLGKTYQMLKILVLLPLTLFIRSKVTCIGVKKVKLRLVDGLSIHSRYGKSISLRPVTY